MVFALLVLEVIPLLALLDCIQRDADEFDGGAEDRRSWTRWLMVGVATG